MDLLGNLFGNAGGNGSPASPSTAQTVIGGYQASQQTNNTLAWIVGGIAVVAISIAAVMIARTKTS